MKRYSFGTFLVDDTNREAFDLCNDVAALRPVPALPILLLAPREGGKTHLLYSIANRIKSTQPGTTLGFVRADAFPAQVQRLVKDPSPIEQASHAVFLVDDVEEFAEHAEILERVVHLFLEHDHAVVLASKSPPDRLENLTPGLREILAGGAVVPMGSYRHEPVAHGHAPGVASSQSWPEFDVQVDRPKDKRATRIERDAGGDTAEMRALRARLRKLETELEHHRAERALHRTTESDVERLRSAVDELKRRNQEAAATIAGLREGASAPDEVGKTEEFANALRHAREAAADSEKRVQALETELAQARDDLKAKASLDVDLAYAKREIAVLEQARQEHEALKQQWEALRTEHARVQAQLVEAAEARDRALAAVRRQEAARAERDEEVNAERARKETLLERMHGLLENIEARRQRAQLEDAAHDRLAHEIEHLAAQRLPIVIRQGSGAGVGDPAGANASHDWEARCQLLEEASQVTQDRANEAAAECMRLQGVVERQQKQIFELEQRVVSLSADKERLDAELGAVRASGQTTQTERKQADEERRLLLEELEQIEQEHQDVLNMLEEQRIELEMTRIALDARDSERESHQSSHGKLIAERDSARAALEAMRAEQERLRTQHKVTQRRLETALAELDALRHEAATQVAAAHAQAGELERRLTAAREQSDYSRDVGQYVAKDLRELEKRFIETAELVSRMSARLTSAVEKDAGAAESAYLYALTRPEAGQLEQLPLDMESPAGSEEEPSRGQPNPYDESKFIPFKPAEHKINRTI